MIEKKKILFRFSKYFHFYEYFLYLKFSIFYQILKQILWRKKILIKISLQNFVFFFWSYVNHSKLYRKFQVNLRAEFFYVVKGIFFFNIAEVILI